MTKLTRSNQTLLDTLEAHSSFKKPRSAFASPTALPMYELFMSSPNGVISQLGTYKELAEASDSWNEQFYTPQRRKNQVYVVHWNTSKIIWLQK